jgi:hypothetical protein
LDVFGVTVQNVDSRRGGQLRDNRGRGQQTVGPDDIGVAPLFGFGDSLIIDREANCRLIVQNLPFAWPNCDLQQY